MVREPGSGSISSSAANVRANFKYWNKNTTYLEQDTASVNWFLALHYKQKGIKCTKRSVWCVLDNTSYHLPFSRLNPKHSVFLCVHFSRNLFPPNWTMTFHAVIEAMEEMIVWLWMVIKQALIIHVTDKQMNEIEIYERWKVQVGEYHIFVEVWRSTYIVLYLLSVDMYVFTVCIYVCQYLSVYLPVHQMAVLVRIKSLLMTD